MGGISIACISYGKYKVVVTKSDRFSDKAGHDVYLHLVITDKGNANTAGTSNLGARYINHAPNGIGKNNPSITPQVCFGVDDGFAADPLTK